MGLDKEKEVGGRMGLTNKKEGLGKEGVGGRLGLTKREQGLGKEGVGGRLGLGLGTGL